MALNNALDEMDLTDIYTAFHPKEEKYTSFSNAHGTFSKINHMIGHKTRLKKFKKNETYQAFSLNTGTETRNQPQGKKLKNTYNHGDQIACY